MFIVQRNAMQCSGIGNVNVDADADADVDVM